MGKKLKEIDIDPKNLAKSKVRLRGTKRIKRMKDKTSHDAKKKTAQRRAKAYSAN